MIQNLADLLQQRLDIKRPRSKRACLIKELSDKLKSDRLENPYYYKGEKRIKLKPLTDRQIAIRVGHYDLQQLEDLLSVCKHSKNFSKAFWAITRVVLDNKK